jgi:hypothetical protein
LALFKSPLCLKVGAPNPADKENLMRDDNEQAFERPLNGEAVDNPPSGLVPARTVLQGTQIRVEPIDPAIHADELYQATLDARFGRTCRKAHGRTLKPIPPMFAPAPAVRIASSMPYGLCPMGPPAARPVSWISMPAMA